jgi:hypothetical protein
MAAGTASLRLRHTGRAGGVSTGGFHGRRVAQDGMHALVPEGYVAPGSLPSLSGLDGRQGQWGHKAHLRLQSATRVSWYHTNLAFRQGEKRENNDAHGQGRRFSPRPRCSCGFEVAWGGWSGRLDCRQPPMLLEMPTCIEPWVMEGMEKIWVHGLASD